MKTIVDVALEKIEEQQSDTLRFLAGGGARDFASYKEATGLLRGLQASATIIKDLIKTAEDDDDE